MRRSRAAGLGCCLALVACGAGPWRRPPLDELLGDAKAGVPPRLSFAGDELIAVAVPAEPLTIPQVVRTTFQAIAPGGETEFLGREWGPRGTGYRLVKRYREGGHEQVRSVLVDGSGAVLERSHSVPLGEVPQDVLSTALRFGHSVEEVRIVSGPEREEGWAVVVDDRAGHTSALTIGLDGRLRERAVRCAARVEAR